MNDNPANFDNPAEALAVALRLEEEGRKFFREAADSCKGQLPKQTFEFLAAEEDGHIVAIESFHASLSGGTLTPLPVMDESATSARFDSFVTNLNDLSHTIKPDMTDMEAYRTAIKFENGAEEFYAEQAASATNEDVRLFFGWLIREEKRHAFLLEKCLKFAEDPAGWFGEKPAD
ncbi:MAG: ferritin family protein [candidate division Zixibacteria bacterium]